MGYYIGMKKISENEDTVSYIFDMLIVDKEYFNKNEYFPYKVDSHTGYGYCTFNKKTKEFIVDKEKTDPYFLENKRYSDCVGMRLIRILKSGQPFPNTTCYGS